MSVYVKSAPESMVMHRRVGLCVCSRMSALLCTCREWHRNVRDRVYVSVTNVACARVSEVVDERPVRRKIGVVKDGDVGVGVGSFTYRRVVPSTDLREFHFVWLPRRQGPERRLPGR